MTFLYQNHSSAMALMLTLLLFGCDLSIRTLALSTPKQPLHSNVNITTTPGTTKSPWANRTVCYPFVGCFDNYTPFENANLDLPLSPSEVGTVMLLFTPEGGSQSEVLDYTNLNTVSSSHYLPTRKTKFIIHGFTNTINSPWLYEIKDELLKKEPMNVVVVAWGPGAALPNYNQAVANTRMVGTQMRLMIDQMLLEGANLADVHLIGHSLGAHASGYTGHLLHGKVGRITGMDPAEPDFEFQPSIIRLEASDAVFVDAIHTNGAPISTGGAGLMQASGHVDFYVNGGKTQPGCPSQLGGVFNHIAHLDFDHVGDTISCSHSRSHVYFKESVNTACPFTAFPCDPDDDFNNGNCLSCGDGGCSQLGYYADNYHARGKLYLNTQFSSPFCGFQYGIEVIPSSSTQGTLAIRLNGEWGTSSWQKLTDTDVTLNNDQSLKKVIASSKEVGEVVSVDLRYTKKPGLLFGFGAGKDSWTASSISVKSGELGESFLFCLSNHIMQHDVPINVKQTHSKSC